MLTILGQPYKNNENCVNKLLNKVPQLTDRIHDYSGQAISLPREKTIMHMQAQGIFVNRRSPIHNFSYIGTKKVHDCLQAFIFHRDSKQCLSIHVDFRKSYQLESMLNRFYVPNNAQLDMWLIGGIENAATSQVILRFFLRDLNQAANKLNLSINLAHQMIFKHDYASANGFKAHVYDTILEQASWFSSFYLRQPLDLKRLSQRSIVDFDKRNSPADDNQLLVMHYLLDFVEILRQESQYTQNKQLAHDQMLQILGLPKPSDQVADNSSINRFYYLVDALLSRQGYKQIINQKGSFSRAEQYGKFRNMVIDIDNYKLYKVSKHQPHVLDDNETECDLVSFELGYDGCEYPLIFDGAYNQFHRHHLSDRFKAHLDLVKQNIWKKGNPITISDHCLNDFKKKTGLENQSVEVLNKVGQLMLATMHPPRCRYNHRNLSQINFQGFFSYKPLSDTYKKTITTSAVNQLQKRYPSLAIQGWQRHEPAYFIDALVTCSSHQHAKIIHDQLTKDGIVSEKLSKKEGTYICIPAINIGQYAENIRRLPEQPNNDLECSNAIAQAIKPMLN